MSANHSTRLGNRIKDLTGQRFGRLTVIGFLEIRNRSAIWNCHCECGNKSTYSTSRLVSGHAKTCGHSQTIDLTGQRFGRLIVIDRDFSKTRRVYWNCLCDCGNRKPISGDKLSSGETKSCGCYSRDQLKINKATHGLTRIGNHHPLHTVWCQMRARCQDVNNPAYHRYGGRGITVCQRWENFENFVADMGNRPSSDMTIDRIDNNGPYSQENCRWANRTDQARNTRNNKHYTLNEKTMTLPEWSEETGISPALLWARIHNLKWSIEKALTTPARRCNRGNNC